MNLGKGISLPNKLGRVILALLMSALVLSLFAALIISRTHMGAARVPLLSAAALFVSSFSGALALGVSGQKRRRFVKGLLYGMVLAVFALMIGFLAASDQMNASGLLRVLIGCFAGGICGTILRGGDTALRQKSRFAFAQKKR